MNCSHCNRPMPRDPEGHEISVGWTVVRLERHNLHEIVISYLYLCELCMIEPRSRQTTLEHT